MMDETPADFLGRLGTDAAKWAAEFRQTAIRLGYGDIDEGWLIGWFANAIEHSRAVDRWAREAAEAAAWQPIETAPRDGTKLLVVRKGYGHGGWVRVIAAFILKHTEESSEDYAEYDENSDCYYTPEGWYEQCYEHEEWSSIRMQTDPLKWQPLPAPPRETPDAR